MKTATAREVNHAFSRFLAEAEAGEEIVITRHGKRVARLVPDKPEMTPEKKAAIDKVIALMREGVPLDATRATRDEMHER